MKFTATEGAEMTAEQTLIESLKDENIIRHPRENSDTMWWLTDGTQRFLSIHDGNVTLWQSNRPYFANERVDSMPMEQATAVTVACMIYA